MVTFKGVVEMGRTIACTTPIRYLTLKVERVGGTEDSYTKNNKITVPIEYYCVPPRKFDMLLRTNCY